MESKKNKRTWIEIDRAAISHNFEVFKKLLSSNCKLSGVVKSNAYGHGLVTFSKELERLGVDYLCVDSIVEALTLRENKIKTQILVLGYTLPNMFQHAADNSISVTISSLENLRKCAAQKFNKILNIHLKLDTGMHRQGLYEIEVFKALKLIEKNNNVRLEGIYTHFADSKNPSDQGRTLNQLKIFNKLSSLVAENGFHPIKHAASTASAIILPESQLDMVRIGIGLYGLWPSSFIKEKFNKKIKLRPVLSWKTIISEIKTVGPNHFVGYGSECKVKKNTTIAVCPIGYWHGYPRSLSSAGIVRIKGKDAKIIGRVAMDMVIIDITKITNVKVGDEVILISSNQKSRNSVDEFADLSGKYNYEVITTLNPLIQKVIIQ